MEEQQEDTHFCQICNKGDSESRETFPCMHTIMLRGRSQMMSTLRGEGLCSSAHRLRECDSDKGMVNLRTSYRNDPLC